MSKELWFAEMERRMSEYDEDYETACERAHGSMMDRLYDHADNMRKRAREEGAERNAHVAEPLRSIVNSITPQVAPARKPND